MFLTQENAVDLHSLSGLPQHSLRRLVEHIQILPKTLVCIAAWCSFLSKHWSPFVTCSIYKNHKVKFMHSSKQEHYVKQLYYPTRTKHDSTSAQHIFQQNTSVTGHKQATVGSRKCKKKLPRLTANSSVSINMCTCIHIYMYESIDHSRTDTAGYSVFTVAKLSIFLLHYDNAFKDVPSHIPTAPVGVTSYQKYRFI